MIKTEAENEAALAIIESLMRKAVRPAAAPARCLRSSCEESPGAQPGPNSCPRPPDIAIEVISTTERASESHDKIRAYLRNGVTEAWQVFPKSQTVEIRRGTTSITLDVTQSISSDLLRGLQIPIASFFA